MSIHGLNPDGITTEFVEFYLEEVGINPIYYETEQLADVWREIEEDGGNILLWYAIHRMKKPGTGRMNVTNWPHPASVQQKFNKAKGVAV